MKSEKQRIILSIIGGGLELTSGILAWVFFSWKLALILFIYSLGKNIQNSVKYIKS